MINKIEIECTPNYYIVRVNSVKVAEFKLKAVAENTALIIENAFNAASVAFKRER